MKTVGVSGPHWSAGRLMCLQSVAGVVQSMMHTLDVVSAHLIQLSLHKDKDVDLVHLLPVQRGIRFGGKIRGIQNCLPSLPKKRYYHRERHVAGTTRFFSAWLPVGKSGFGSGCVGIKNVQLLL
jgi:hypothetical protein